MVLLVFFCIAVENAEASFTLSVGAGQEVDGEVVDGHMQRVSGVVNNTEVVSFGWQIILDGGVANFTTLNGGKQWVASGGVSNFLKLMAGDLNINGVANNADVGGGEASISAGSGPITDPYSGGAMNSSVVSGGGELTNRFGIDSNTVVNAGGVLRTGYDRDHGNHNSALSLNAVINSGGKQIVENGATSNGSLIQVGGGIFVEQTPHDVFSLDTAGPASGIAKNTTVFGTMQNNGGLDEGTLIKFGGRYVSQYIVTKPSISQGVIARSSKTVVEAGGTASLKAKSLASEWRIEGGEVTLDADTAQINDSVITRDGHLTINKGVAANTLVNDGYLVNAVGRDLNTVVAAGQYELGFAGGVLGMPSSTNLQVGRGARANVIHGAVQGQTYIAGVMNLGVQPQSYNPLRAAVLTGDVQISPTGTLNMFHGANTGNANLDVAGELKLSHEYSNVANQYVFNLGALNNSGRVVLGQPNGGYSTLNLKSLNGSGQFWMNTDLSTLQGDQIRVEGETLGAHTLVVSDSGNEPHETLGHLTLVDGNGGAGTFALAGGHLDAGAFRYVLEKQGQDWVLANSAAPVVPGIIVDPEVDPKEEGLSKGANAAVATQTARAALWNAETDGLMQRLGDLRQGKDTGGVWMRSTNHKYAFDNDNSRAFDQNISGVQIGADQAFAVDTGTLRVGGLFGAAKSRQDFGEQAKGNIESKTFGAYTTYLQDDGVYVDAVAKISRFDTEVKTPTNLGRGVKGSFGSNAYGVSVEAGKRIQFDHDWFVEPQVQLSSAHIEGGRYVDTNGLKARYQDIDSLQSRLGVLMGKEVHFDSGVVVQPYVKGSWIAEHAGDAKVAVNGYKLDSELMGERGVVVLGAALKSGNSQLSLDTEYAKGNGITEPWTVNIGYRYSM